MPTSFVKLSCGTGQWVERGGGWYKYICTHLQFFFFFSLLPSATTICNHLQHATVEPENVKSNQLCNFGLFFSLLVYGCVWVFSLRQ